MCSVASAASQRKHPQPTNTLPIQERRGFQETTPVSEQQLGGMQQRAVYCKVLTNAASVYGVPAVSAATPA